MTRPPSSTGHSGRSIDLQCNFFRLACKGLDSLFQYDVSLITERAPRSSRLTGAPAPPVERDVAAEMPVSVNRAVFRRFLKKMGTVGVAYDGRKIAYAATDVTEVKDGVTIGCGREGGEPEAGEKIRWYTVRFVRSTVVDSGTLRDVLEGKIDAMSAGVQSVINALDVVLSEGNSLRFVEVDRTFYSDALAVDLGGGAQAWRGFYKSIRLTSSGTTVNVDESFTAFYMNGTLYDVCAKANGGRLPTNARDWRRLGRDILSLRVRNSYNRLTYRVFGFTDKGADETRVIDKAKNVQVTVADYMQSTYGVRLLQPHLPCVRTSLHRDVFLPLEMLEVCENQRRTKAMTPQQTSQMIRTAALKPDVRQQSAQRSVETASYNTDATCQAFLMQVDAQMMKVKGRILDVPRLEYRDKKTMQPRKGGWTMASNKMHFGVGVYHWVVVQIGSYMHKEGRMGVNNLVQEMVNTGAQNGVTFGGDAPMQYNVDARISPAAYEKFLTDLINKRNKEIKAVNEKHYLQLVVILKEKTDAPIYNMTKRVCDVLQGVASQCMLTSKIVNQRHLDQYVSNVMLKINAKLGGHNVKVQRSMDPNQNPKFIDTPHIVLFVLLFLSLFDPHGSAA